MGSPVMPDFLCGVDSSDWSFRKKSVPKEKGLSIRDELQQRLDVLESKKYNFSSKKKQKKIRAVVMLEKLDRWIK